MTLNIDSLQVERNLRNYISSMQADCPGLIEFSWFREMTTDKWISAAINSIEFMQPFMDLSIDKKPRLKLSEAIEVLTFLQRFPEVREARKVQTLLADQNRDAEGDDERNAVITAGAFALYIRYSMCLAHKRGYFTVIGYPFRIDFGEFYGVEDPKLHRHLIDLNLVEV